MPYGSQCRHDRQGTLRRLLERLSCRFPGRTAGNRQQKPSQGCCCTVPLHTRCTASYRVLRADLRDTERTLLHPKHSIVQHRRVHMMLPRGCWYTFPPHTDCNQAYQSFHAVPRRTECSQMHQMCCIVRHRTSHMMLTLGMTENGPPCTHDRHPSAMTQ